MFYSLTDCLHFARMYGRNRRRQRVWGKLYEEAVRSKSFKLPVATVVQLIPTEACNLRCPFCNQWGENGYFFDGVRRVEHMDVEGLTKLRAGARRSIGEDCEAGDSFRQDYKIYRICTIS